jgi:hypothetical protein
MSMQSAHIPVYGFNFDSSRQLRVHRTFVLTIHLLCSATHHLFFWAVRTSFHIKLHTRSKECSNGNVFANIRSLFLTIWRFFVSYGTWPRNAWVRSYFTDSKHKACYVSRTSTVMKRVVMSAELTADCPLAVATCQWCFQFVTLREVCDNLSEWPWQCGI